MVRSSFFKHHGEPLLFGTFGDLSSCPRHNCPRAGQGKSRVSVRQEIAWLLLFMSTGRLNYGHGSWPNPRTLVKLPFETPGPVFKTVKLFFRMSSTWS